MSDIREIGCKTYIPAFQTPLDVSPGRIVYLGSTFDGIGESEEPNIYFIRAPADKQRVIIESIDTHPYASQAFDASEALGESWMSLQIWRDPAYEEGINSRRINANSHHNTPIHHIHLALSPRAYGKYTDRLIRKTVDPLQFQILEGVLGGLNQFAINYSPDIGLQYVQEDRPFLKLGDIGVELAPMFASSGDKPNVWHRNDFTSFKIDKSTKLTGFRYVAGMMNLTDMQSEEHLVVIGFRTKSPHLPAFEHDILLMLQHHMGARKPKEVEKLVRTLVDPFFMIIPKED